MSYRLSDNVLRRVVQLLQEGLLTGTDVTDHMRMIRLEENTDVSEQLELTTEYKKLVDGQHESMLREVDDLKVNTQEV